MLLLSQQGWKRRGEMHSVMEVGFRVVSLPSEFRENCGWCGSPPVVECSNPFWLSFLWN